MLMSLIMGSRLRGLLPRALLLRCGGVPLFGQAPHEDVAAGYAGDPRARVTLLEGGRTLADDGAEPAGERPQRAEADGMADLGDREVRRSQQVLGPLDPAPGHVVGGRQPVGGGE